MKCAYCDREIRGRWYYYERMPPFKLEQFEMPTGDLVSPMTYSPQRQRVCVECLEDMGIHMTK